MFNQFVQQVDINTESFVRNSRALQKITRSQSVKREKKELNKKIDVQEREGEREERCFYYEAIKGVGVNWWKRNIGGERMRVWERASACVLEKRCRNLVTKSRVKWSKEFRRLCHFYTKGWTERRGGWCCIRKVFHPPLPTILSIIRNVILTFNAYGICTVRGKYIHSLYSTESVKNDTVLCLNVL